MRKINAVLFAVWCEMYYLEKFKNILSDISRRKKYLIINKLLVNNPLTIVDVGCGKGDFLEYYMLLDSHNRHFIKNIIGIDLREEYLNEIKKKYNLKQTIRCDASTLPFKDKSIDLICSNAVLEHLTKDKQEMFAKEIERVAKNYWVSCPYKYSLIEVHYKLPFLGWFPENIQNNIINFLRIQSHNDPINLIGYTEFKRLFKEANEFHIINIYGLFKHMIAIKK